MWRKPTTRPRSDLEIARAQIHPADHAGDELVAGSQVNEKFSFGFGLVGLDRDGRIDAVGGEFGLEIAGQEVAAQHRHVGGNPRVAYRIEFPEVLMGIDSHRALSREA